jgi:hypothetical protein
MQPEANDDRYQVGYKRPPRDSQFRKGQSGNPKGRKRGAKNMATLLTEALDRTVTLTHQGERRTFSKREVIIEQLVNKAAKADVGAVKLLLDMVNEHEARAGAQSEPAALSEADREALRFICNHRLGGSKGEPDVGS